MTRLSQHFAARGCALAGLFAGLLACSAAAWALHSSLTAQGVPYVTGGVSRSELNALRAKRNDYSLWVVTAAAKSGAHLADVRVIIRDAEQNTAFNRPLDGPWLFIDLPTGKYEIEATFRGETQRRTTNIRPGDHHQVVFYFKTGDAVSPDKDATVKNGL